MGIRFIGTLANRLITALLNFLIVVITARYLGTEGRGEISLIVLAISMIQMISGVMGGGAIVYLAPRYPQFKIMMISIGWTILICITCSAILNLFGLIKPGFVLPILILSLLVSFFANMQSLLLARQNFSAFNLTSVLQPLTLLVVFYFSIKRDSIHTIDDFIDAAYIGYALPLALTLFLLKPAPIADATWKEVAKKFIHHGGWSQLANLAQLLNYRFSYYLIEKMQGVTSLGIFSTGISVSESVWVFSKSLSTVKYANSANEKDRTKLHQQAILLIKFSITGTLFLLCILCFIPDTFYMELFSKSFKGIQSLMIHLSPGIFMLSIYTILAAYFSGTGRHHLSSKASMIGLAVTIPACFFLIPAFGITGAVWAGNLSHLANGSFLLIHFMRETKISLSNMLPYKKDLAKFKELMQGN